MTHVGIVEVAAHCERMRDVNLELFETLGGWVVSTDDPALQRTFAIASHRHAWHAQLWADRAPAIQRVTGSARGTARWPELDAVPSADRGTAYRAALDELTGELQTTAARIDATLDPSTIRVIDLVTSDLASIRSHLDGPAS